MRTKIIILSLLTILSLSLAVWSYSAAVANSRTVNSEVYSQIPIVCSTGLDGGPCNPNVFNTEGLLFLTITVASSSVLLLFDIKTYIKNRKVS